MNIVAPVLLQAKINPDGLAVCTPGGAREAITYGELARAIAHVGHVARADGIGSGDLVAIAVKDKIIHATLALGLTLMGAVTLSVDARGLPAALGADVLVTDDVYAAKGARRVLMVDRRWTSAAGALAVDTPVQTADSAACRAVLVSNAGQEARAIATSHAAMWRAAGCCLFMTGNRSANSSRLLCDVDCGAAEWFVTLVAALSRGATIFFAAGGADSMLQAFDLYKVDAMIAAPQELAGYLALFEAHGAFECGLDHIVCVGGPIERDLLHRVNARMCGHVFYGYGWPETGLVATGPARLMTDIPDAVGIVVPDATVEIVDDRDVAVSPDVRGALRVRTPSMTGQYLGDQPADTGRFRDGWFYPGAVGCLTAGGFLSVG